MHWSVSKNAFKLEFWGPPPPPDWGPPTFIGGVTRLPLEFPEPSITLVFDYKPSPRTLLNTPACIRMLAVCLQSYARNFFLRVLSQEKSVFQHYLHFYVSYDHNFFTDVFPWCQGMFLIPITRVQDDFWQPYSCLKLSLSPQNVQNSKISDLSGSHSEAILR